jgi:hypothetical protein
VAALGDLKRHVDPRVLDRVHCAWYFTFVSILHVHFDAYRSTSYLLVARSLIDIQSLSLVAAFEVCGRSRRVRRLFVALPVLRVLSTNVTAAAEY